MMNRNPPEYRYGMGMAFLVCCLDGRDLDRHGLWVDSTVLEEGL